MSNRISDRIAEHVESAIADHAHGEEVLWEAVFLPNQTGSVTATLIFWLPGVVLGSKMVGSVRINEDPAHLDATRLSASLREFFEEMRAARSRQAAQEIKVEPASGLIVPGRR